MWEGVRAGESNEGKMGKIIIEQQFKKFFKYLSLFKRFYLFIYFREKGREGEGEGDKYQCVVASCKSLLGTWPTTQVCALTGN